MKETWNKVEAHMATYIWFVVNYRPCMTNFEADPDSPTVCTVADATSGNSNTKTTLING